MSIIICTNEDMVAGGIPLEDVKCPFCCKIGNQIVGYIGTYCPNCKMIWSSDHTMGYVAKKRRELLGLTRRQVGCRVSRAPNTIKNYEWTECPQWYFDRLEVMLESEYHER